MLLSRCQLVPRGDHPVAPYIMHEKLFTLLQEWLYFCFQAPEVGRLSMHSQETFLYLCFGWKLKGAESHEQRNRSRKRKQWCKNGMSCNVETLIKTRQQFISFTYKLIYFKWAVIASCATKRNNKKKSFNWFRTNMNQLHFPGNKCAN